MIHLNNISYKYDTKYILKNISLKIKDDITILIGPSGSGKTTLLHIMSQLIKPTTGIVHSNFSRYAYVFQNHFLINELTIYENIELAMNLNNIYNTHAIKYLLKELNIVHHMNHYPKNLSGGELQRAAIARALSINPEILFADEPTSNLDYENAKIVMEILFNLNCQVIIASHAYEFLQDVTIINMYDINPLNKKLQ